MIFKCACCKKETFIDGRDPRWIRKTFFYAVCVVSQIQTKHVLILEKKKKGGAPTKRTPYKRQIKLLKSKGKIHVH